MLLAMPTGCRGPGIGGAVYCVPETPRGARQRRRRPVLVALVPWICLSIRGVRIQRGRCSSIAGLGGGMWS